MVAGSVVDAATGETLPGATIQIEGTFVGTITNESGAYSLRVSDFPVTLSVQYIGYQTVVRSIPGPPGDAVVFALPRSLIALPEIVVSGENPAINIMRQVIEEKKRWRESLDTYRVNAYNRFRMENDTGIVSIWESSTLAFWDKERGTREISLEQKQTDNADIDELLPAAMFMKNLYDDDIEIAGHTLMGVTHPDALNYYSFSISGTRAQDGILVYDIDVEPRSKLGSGFVGSVAILDSLYGMLYADLRPGESFLFPMPIKKLTARYRQQFSRFGSNVWLPVDLRSTITLEISFQGLLSFPTFRIEQFSRLSDFEINTEVPDSLFETDTIIAADSTLLSRMAVADLESFAIPLTADEVRAYETIDSTMTLEQAFKPRGLLARFVDMTDDSSSGGNNKGSGSGSRGKGGESFIGRHVDARVSPDGWYNQVEGMHIGGTLSAELFRAVTLSGRVGYQTSREDWTYGAGIRTGRSRWIAAGYRDHVPRRYSSSINGRLLNSVNVLLSQPDYFDYLHERVGYVSAGTRIPGVKHVTARLMVADARHRNVSRTISGGLVGTPDTVIPNADIDEGSLQTVSLRLDYENDSVPFGIGGEYAAWLDVERSLGGSVVENGQYTRFRGSLVWRIPTFYSRRFLPNTLDFKIVAGTYSGRLARQRFGTVDGSTFLTTFGGLRTRKDRPLEGESYAAIMAEHSFRTIFFERLGLHSLVRNGWNVILTGAVAKTWVSAGRVDDYSPVLERFDKPYTEIGISLSGFFSLVRVDFAQRLDKPGNSIGITVARMF